MGNKASPNSTPNKNQIEQIADAHTGITYSGSPSSSETTDTTFFQRLLRQVQQVALGDKISFPSRVIN